MNKPISESKKIDIIKIKVENEASSSFCLAKWHHVTLYLQTGETHSCYHPAPHKIPLDEILDNPSALHNTNHKKLERQQMLKGEKPSGCQYCWNIEAMGPDYISDRHIRNASIYTDARFTETVKGPWNQNINPEYIEVSFGNECNFKCGYCHPKASSRFYNEIKQFGPVTTVQNHRCDIDWMDLYEREAENPYVDAWWDWWPELSKTLNILRITGGEPLMHTSTWKLLDSLRTTPMPALELNINSNLGVKHALVNRLIKEVNHLGATKSVKQFKLFTSIDTWGDRAEYIRTGLDLKIWQTNFHAILSETSFPVTFMITFNILAVTTFKDLLKKILEWRTQYRDTITNGKHRIRFDTPYLKEPLQYDMNILPKDEFIPYMLESLQFMEQNVDDADLCKFTTVEYEKFRRVVDYMAATNYDTEKLTQGRKDFFNWFNEMDRRRSTNFQTTFPEMQQFYNDCGNL